MKNLSFSERFKTNKDDVFLVKGKDRDIDCWHYVEVPKLVKPIFKKNTIVGEKTDLQENSRIIVSGWGEPHPHIVAQIEKFGASYNHEEDEVWQEIIISKSNIYYVQAKDPNNDEFHAYVAVNGLIADIFIEEVSRGNTNLNKYGAIIFTDWGFPSEETKKEMTEKYKVDHDYIDSVLAKALEGA